MVVLLFQIGNSSLCAIQLAFNHVNLLFQVTVLLLKCFLLGLVSDELLFIADLNSTGKGFSFFLIGFPLVPKFKLFLFLLV